MVGLIPRTSNWSGDISQGHLFGVGFFGARGVLRSNIAFLQGSVAKSKCVPTQPL